MNATSSSAGAGEDRPFPDGFLWSAATSPTQIEGETENEWRTFVARDGTTADQTSTHWRRPDRDLNLLARLKLNAYRFGIDWGRLQSGPLQPLDETALAGYESILQGLKERGIEPLVTLFHFACPQWLAADRGWVNPAAVEYFLDFVRRLAEREWPVRYWITMNEPGVYMTMSYLIGLFPPQKRFRFGQAFKVLEHQSLAHKGARLLLKSHAEEALVGISKHFKRFLPHRIWHPVDRMTVRMIKRFFNAQILDAFLMENDTPACDFIGVNYYGRMRIKGFRDISPVSGVPREFFEALGSPSDDMWEQDPRWLKKLLQRLHHEYRLPILITESGFASADEALRRRLVYEHLEMLQEAAASGVDVRGFSYWSLMDNFEWAEGTTKRFGLASVDFDNPDMPRTITPTGKLLARIARANALVPFPA